MPIFSVVTKTFFPIERFSTLFIDQKLLQKLTVHHTLVLHDVFVNHTHLMFGCGVVFFLKKWANPVLFSFLFGLFKQTLHIFTTNRCEKMSIQYMVPGFELTTFGTRVSSRNH